MDDAQPGFALDQRRRLHPSYVDVQRLARWIAAGVILAGLGVQVFVRLFAGQSALTLGLEWLAAAALLAFWAHVWPGIAWRHASYVVSSDGIEIRRGVLWRTVINVPRSRVQHTDVSQGPLERSFHLGSLAVYTAGTEHARVRLPGLAHGTALEIRDHLLPGQASDAV